MKNIKSVIGILLVASFLLAGFSVTASNLTYEKEVIFEENSIFTEDEKELIIPLNNIFSSRLCFEENEKQYKKEIDND